MTHQWWKRVAGLALAVPVVLPHLAEAAQRGRMPLQNFFADFYDAGAGTYIPVLALIIVIMTVLNWNFGWVSIGEGLGKMILSVAILGGGVGLILGMVGGNIAEGATRPLPVLEYVVPLGEVEER